MLFCDTKLETLGDELYFCSPLTFQSLEREPIHNSLDYGYQHFPAEII